MVLALDLQHVLVGAFVEQRAHLGAVQRALNRLEDAEQSFQEALAELGSTNPNVVVLDADLSKSTYTAEFGKKLVSIR